MTPEKADALLMVIRNLHDAGVRYDADFKRVLETLQGICENSDPLTLSFVRQALQAQTAIVTSKLDEAIAEIAALRSEIRSQTRVAAA